MTFIYLTFGKSRVLWKRHSVWNLTNLGLKSIAASEPTGQPLIFFKTLWNLASICSSVKWESWQLPRRDENWDQWDLKGKVIWDPQKFTINVHSLLLCSFWAPLDYTTSIKKPDTLSNIVQHFKNIIYFQWWLCDLYKIKHLLPTK